MASTTKNKKILIHNKFYKLDHKIGKDYCHNNDDYQSTDRLYSIVDQVLTCNVRVKNSFLGFFYNYWFYSSDFKKQRSLSSMNVNKSRILVNLIFLLSIIGLILCLIFGLAMPIIRSAFDSYRLFNGKFEGPLTSNGHIIGWILNQSSLYPVINNIKNTLVNAQSDVNSFMNNTNTIWLQQYLILYGVKYGLIENVSNVDATVMSNCIKSLIDHLNQNMVDQFSYVYFTEDIQTLAYFSLVSNTLPSNITSDANALTSLFSSYSNGVFTSSLIKDTIFNGLKSTRICLNGNQATQALLIPDVWAAWFSDTQVIIPLCLTLLFLSSIIFHYYTIKKNKPKFYSMSMYDYVSAKVKFTKKWNFLLKKMVFLNKNIVELKHNFILNFHRLDNSSVYNTLRLLNYAFASIESMSIILVADYDPKLLETYKVILKDDLKNLTITIVDEDELNPIFNLEAQPSVNKFNIVDEIDNQQLLYNQYRNYLYNYLNNWEDKNNFVALKDKLSSLAKTDKSGDLSEKNKQVLIDEVSKLKINFNKNKMMNKTRIGIRSFNKNINNLVSKIVSANDETQG